MKQKLYLQAWLSNEQAKRMLEEFFKDSRGVRVNVNSLLRIRESGDASELRRRVKLPCGATVVCELIHRTTPVFQIGLRLPSRKESAVQSHRGTVTRFMSAAVSVKPVADCSAWCKAG